MERIRGERIKKKNPSCFIFLTIWTFFFSWDGGQHLLFETVISTQVCALSSALLCCCCCRCSARLDTVEDAGDVQHRDI